ncbi:MAG: hypothetical protein HS105_04575 [Chloracidobacterium sp.]|nr:hypothetical protein [Chloracidobacterium sp.]MCO5333054.1 hypothetical protein [Pyrinomonadaceae bacterium]
MSKTSVTTFRRSFLAEGLPDPLTRASSHLQIFDNYFINTRLRSRRIRDPQANSIAHVLQLVSSNADTGCRIINTAELHLNEPELSLFDRFGGREIRKNRYFHEVDGRNWYFDIYLGEPHGLCIAIVDSLSEADAAAIEPPPFALFEITNNEFFEGASLVDRTAADIAAEVSNLGASDPIQAHVADE